MSSAVARISNTHTRVLCRALVVACSSRSRLRYQSLLVIPPCFAAQTCSAAPTSSPYMTRAAQSRHCFLSYDLLVVPLMSRSAHLVSICDALPLTAGTKSLAPKANHARPRSPLLCSTTRGALGGNAKRSPSKSVASMLRESSSLRARLYVRAGGLPSAGSEVDFPE